jgi:hypothetical protein
MSGLERGDFFIVICRFFGCLVVSASSYFLSCVNYRLVSEKTSAESGVNVGMFSEICLDVFLSFVQKIKMFVQKQKGSCRAEIKNDSRNLC